MGKISVKYSLLLVLMIEFVVTVVDLAIEANQYKDMTIQAIARVLQNTYETVSKENNPDKMEELLVNLHNLKRISFYEVLNERMPASINGEEYVIDGTIHAKTDEDNNLTNFYIGFQSGDKKIIIGDELPKNYIQNFAAHNAYNTWMRVGIICTLMLAVLLYSLKDFIKLNSALKWNRVGLGKGSGHFGSSEANAIASALSLAQDQIQKNSNELERMRLQLFPSLRAEFESEQSLPYNFDAILARIDINNATQVYTRPELKYIQSYWFDFFKVNSAEIATRYGGVVHEELGDEIILYFKVKGAQDYALALSACRDIIKMCQDINEHTMRDFNYPFTIKGVLDLGKLRVYKSSLGGDRSNQYRLKIEGVAEKGTKNLFLSTVRLLKLVEDKSHSSLLVSDEITKNAQEVIQESLPLVGMPLQFSEFGQYTWIKRFVELQSSASSKLVEFYRKDEDLKTQLENIRQSISVDGSPEGSSVNLSMDLLRLFKSITIPSPSSQLQEAWLNTLESLLNSNVDTKFISSYITTGESIVKFLHFDPEFAKRFEAILSQCLTHKDDRIQANSIELWGKLNLNTAPIQKKLSLFRHNRALANALVVRLTKDLNPKELRTLKALIKNKDPFMRAAACYACSEIYKYFKENSPITLETNSDLSEIIIRASQCVNDKNEMVQRQALKVLRLLPDSVKNAA